MAITKVGAMTDPPVAGDYTILQAKLDAYAKQIGNQGMILTQWTRQQRQRARVIYNPWWNVVCCGY